MGKFDGWLLASDLDGTLLTSDRQISPANRAAIADFVQQGGRFTVATGRARQGAAKYVAQIVTNAPHIYLNGSLTCDQGGEVLSFIHMPPRSDELLADVMARFPFLGAEVYLPDEVYVCQNSAVTERHMTMVHLPLILRALGEFPGPDHWCKINLTADPAPMVPVRHYVQQQYTGQFALAHSTPEFFEITHPEANKGVALLRLAQRLGIAADHVAAIGDNYNDQHMLTMAGVSFVPQNADKEIQALATQVVRSNDDSAVADAIDRIARF